MNLAARLRREVATRDAFLLQLYRGLAVQVAALDDRVGKPARDLASFVREVGMVAGDAAAMVPRRARVDLATLTEPALAACLARVQGMKRANAMKKGVPAIQFTRSGVTAGHFDPDQLETVVIELVSNAMKYGGGAAVEVDVRGTEGGERGRLVVLTVSDRGSGITSSRSRRFARGVGVQRLPGFGLGLWLVRRIVGAHGGTLRLVRSSGGGTRAVVRLPVGSVPDRRRRFRPARPVT